MLAATLASEWTKLRSLRSTSVTIAIAIVLGTGLSALAALAIGASYDDWSAADRADFDPADLSLLGGVAAGICFVVLGVKVVSSEYASGMMRTTLTATPRRGRVLAAKALVVSAVTIVAGTIAGIAMFAATQLVLGAYDVPTASLAHWDELRAIGVSSLVIPVLPLIGTAMAVLLRSAAGAITSVLALVFIPGIAAELVPSWWEDDVLPCLPNAASDSLAGMSPDGAGMLPPALAAVVLVAWLAAFLGPAWLVLERRDA